MEARVVTQLDPSPVWLYVRQLLGSDLSHAARPRFPRTSTVTKERVRLPVDGRSRSFALYACGEKTIAVATIDGRTLSIECERAALAAFEVVRLGGEARWELGVRAVRERSTGPQP